MDITNDMLESLRRLTGSPDLQIFADKNWGSQNPEHRNLLRAKISEINPDLELHTSLSHAHDLGVIVLSSSPVGVDAELTARVTERPVARMSSPAEMQESPGFASLWCAKEAAFKALKIFDQPSVISQISIGDWQKIDSQIETFRLTNADNHSAPSDGRGVVFHLRHHTLAIFIFCS